MWKIIAVDFMLALSILLIGWATRLFNVYPATHTLTGDTTIMHSNSDVLRHTERESWTMSWLLESGVCELGKIMGWVCIALIIVAMLVYTLSSNRVWYGRHIAGFIIFIIIVGGAITYYMNRPLAIRLLPAVGVVLLTVMLLLAR